MQVSFTTSLATDRPVFPLGRICAHGPWRAAVGEAEREAALRALVREAEEYGAEGVVEAAFEVEECLGGECGGMKLRRVVATGRAVKLAVAA